MEETIPLRRSTRKSVVAKTEELTPRKKNVTTPIKVEPTTPSRRTRASSATPKKSLIDVMLTPRKTLPVLNEEETPKKKRTKINAENTLVPKKGVNDISPINTDNTKTPRRNATGKTLRESTLTPKKGSFEGDEKKPLNNPEKPYDIENRLLTRSKSRAMGPNQSTEVCSLPTEMENNSKVPEKQNKKSVHFGDNESVSLAGKSDFDEGVETYSAKVPKIIVTDCIKPNFKEAIKAENIGKENDCDLIHTKSPVKAEDIDIKSPKKVPENCKSNSEASLVLNEMEITNLIHRSLNSQEDAKKIKVHKTRKSLEFNDSVTLDQDTSKYSGNDIVLHDTSPEKAIKSEKIFKNSPKKIETNSSTVSEEIISESPPQFKDKGTKKSLESEASISKTSAVEAILTKSTSEISPHKRRKVENENFITSEQINTNKSDTAVVEKNFEMSNNTSEIHPAAVITGKIISAKVRKSFLENKENMEVSHLMQNVTSGEKKTLKPIDIASTNKQICVDDNSVNVIDVEASATGDDISEIHSDNGVDKIRTLKPDIANLEEGNNELMLAEVITSDKKNITESVVLNTERKMENESANPSEINANCKDTSNLSLKIILDESLSKPVVTDNKNTAGKKVSELMLTENCGQKSPTNIKDTLTSIKSAMVEIKFMKKSDEIKKDEGFTNSPDFETTMTTEPSMLKLNNNDFIEPEVVENINHTNADDMMDIIIKNNDTKTENITVENIIESRNIKIDESIETCSQVIELGKDSVEVPEKTVFERDITSSTVETEYNEAASESLNNFDGLSTKSANDALECKVIESQNKIKNSENIDTSFFINKSSNKIQGNVEEVNSIKSINESGEFISHKYPKIIGHLKRNSVENVSYNDCTFTNVKSDSTLENHTTTLSVNKSVDSVSKEVTTVEGNTKEIEFSECPAKTEEINSKDNVELDALLMSPKDFLNFDEDGIMDDEKSQCFRLKTDKDVKCIPADSKEHTLESMTLEKIAINKSDDCHKMDVSSKEQENYNCEAAITSNEDNIKTFVKDVMPIKCNSFEINDKSIDINLKKVVSDVVNIPQNIDLKLVNDIKETCVILSDEVLKFSTDKDVSNISSEIVSNCKITNYKSENIPVTQAQAAGTEAIEQTKNSMSTSLTGNHVGDFVICSEGISISTTSSLTSNNERIETENSLQDNLHGKCYPKSSENINSQLDEDSENSNSVELLQTKHKYKRIISNNFTSDSDELSEINLEKKRNTTTIFSESEESNTTAEIEPISVNDSEMDQNCGTELSGKDFIDFEAEVGEECSEIDNDISEETSSSCSTASKTSDFLDLEAKDSEKQRYLEMDYSDNSDDLDSSTDQKLIIKRKINNSTNKGKSRNSKPKYKNTSEYKSIGLQTKKKEWSKSGIFIASNILKENCSKQHKSPRNVSHNKHSKLLKKSQCLNEFVANSFTVSLQSDSKLEHDNALRALPVTQAKPDIVTNKLAQWSVVDSEIINQKEQRKEDMKIRRNMNKSRENKERNDNKKEKLSSFAVTLILPASATVQCIKNALNAVGLRNVCSINLIKPKVAVVEFTTEESVKKALELYGKLMIDGKPIYVLESN